MNKRIVLLACFHFAFSSVSAKENKEIRELYILDQTTRQAGNIDWVRLAK